MSKEKYNKDLVLPASDEEKKRIIAELINNKRRDLQSQISKAEDLPQEEPDQQELEEKELRSKLLFMGLNNPDIVNTKVDDKLKEKIDGMDISEVRMRLQHARLLNMKKVNGDVNKKAIHLVNGLVGSIFGCSEELNNATDDDTLLQESFNELTADYLVNIPAYMRALGLYGMHLSSSIAKSHVKRADEQTPLEAEDEN